MTTGKYLGENLKKRRYRGGMRYRRLKLVLALTHLNIVSIILLNLERNDKLHSESNFE